MRWYYETISDSAVHTAAPFKGGAYVLLLPLAVVLCLTVAVAFKFSFLASVVLMINAAKVSAKFAPTGLLSSRRNNVKLTQDGYLQSTLDRDVIAVLSAQFGFDVNALNPMTKFTAEFDRAEGAKDGLSHGFMFGWRLVIRPLCLHVLRHETIRKEKILYVDENIRITNGGDILKDGSVRGGLSVFVRVLAE